MVSDEEIKLIKDNLSKIKYWYDENDELYLHPTSIEPINIVNEHLDVLKENFKYFAIQTNAILYPDQFVLAIQEFEGGKELICENLDFLLKKMQYKREVFVGAVSQIDGIEDVLVSDFKNKFNLFVNSSEEEEDKYVNNPEYDNYSIYEIPYDKIYRIRCFMSAVLKSPRAPEVIEQNKDVIFSPKYNAAMLMVMELLESKPECHDILKNNITQIKKAFLEKDIPEFYKTLKNVYPEEYDKHKFIIEQIYEPSMKYLKEHKKEMTDDDYQIVNDKIRNTCGRIIAQNRSKEIETLLTTVANGNKIELCHNGGTAIVVKTNEKVFKFSADKLSSTNFKMKYHPRILRPIIRKKDVSNNPQKPLFIEVEDEADVDIEVTDEELIGIYKELRESGIKWCDARKENLGRLKKDNLGYPGGYNIPANDESLGFVPNDNVEYKVLKAGELVIIDNDAMYDVNDLDATFTPQTPKFIVDLERELQKQDEEKAKKLVKKPEMPEEH